MMMMMMMKTTKAIRNEIDNYMYNVRERVIGIYDYFVNRHETPFSVGCHHSEQSGVYERATIHTRASFTRGILQLSMWKMTPSLLEVNRLTKEHNNSM